MRLSLVVAVGLAVTCLALLVGEVRGADPEIALVIENNRFAPEEVKVKAGVPFVLVITNKDKGPEEFESKRPAHREDRSPPARRSGSRCPPSRQAPTASSGEYHEKTAKGRIVAE